MKVIIDEIRIDFK